jgi:hypothetical protein
VAQNVTYLCNFRKTAQAKTHPMGENSPNLVTLIETQVFFSLRSQLKRFVRLSDCSNAPDLSLRFLFYFKDQTGFDLLSKYGGTTSSRKIKSRKQGCQIFLVQTYQNGEKYTNEPETTPNCHTLYRMARNYTKWP